MRTDVAALARARRTARPRWRPPRPGRHLPELRLAEQHRAGSLRHPVHGDLELARRCAAPRRARSGPRRSGSPRGTRRHRESAPRSAAALVLVRAPGARVLLPAFMRRLPLRCRVSRFARGRPRRIPAAIRRWPSRQRSSPVVDQEGVLGLPAARDARVPGDGVSVLDPLPVPGAVALARGDLELALAVRDRAALVVLAPCAWPADLGIGVVAGAQHVAIRRADTGGP